MFKPLPKFRESLLWLLVLSGGSTGCSAQSTTEPVVVVGENDLVLRGTTTSSSAGGSFSVSNVVLTCTGNFDTHDQSPTISMFTRCSDGRSGSVISNRDPSGNSGSGTVTFSDGTTAVFFFGPNAPALANARIESLRSMQQQNNSPPSQPALEMSPPTPVVTTATPRRSDFPRYVAMQYVGGIYVVPVLINKAITLNFIVDSGATDVSIPADVVSTLMRTGTIQRSDFLGNKTYALADGSTLPSPTFRIRSLGVGDRLLQNVTASIADVRATPLLGQSFLGRFKSWSIDNSRHALVLE